MQIKIPWLRLFIVVCDEIKAGLLLQNIITANQNINCVSSNQSNAVLIWFIKSKSLNFLDKFILHIPVYFFIKDIDKK